MEIKKEKKLAFKLACIVSLLVAFLLWWSIYVSGYVIQNIMIDDFIHDIESQTYLQRSTLEDTWYQEDITKWEEFYFNPNIDFLTIKEDTIISFWFTELIVFDYTALKNLDQGDYIVQKFNKKKYLLYSSWE